MYYIRQVTETLLNLLNARDWIQEEKAAIRAQVREMEERGELDL